MTATLTTAKGIREERAKLIREAQEKHSRAAQEKRALTADEAQFIDRILGYYDKDGKRVEGEEERMKKEFLKLEGDEARAAEITNRFKSLDDELRSVQSGNIPAIPGVTTGEVRGTDGATNNGAPLSKKGKRQKRWERDQQQRLKSLAFRGWCTTGTGHTRNEWREAAKQTGLELAQTEFQFRIPRPEDRKAVYRFEQRAGVTPTQTSVIGTSGAILVPETLMRSVEIALKAYWDLDLVTHIKTDGVGPLIYPQNNDTTIKGHRITDGTQVTPKPITLSKLTLQAYLYTSDVVLIPIALMTDTAVPIEGLVGHLLGIRIGRILADEFTTGTGNGMPYGIVSQAPLGYTAALSTGLSPDDIYNLKHSVDPEYRKGPNVAFMMHDKILLQVKLLKSGIGTYLFQPGLASNAPDTLDGNKITINQSMSSAISSGKTSMLYGDLSKYIVREVETSYKLVRLVERYMDQACIGMIMYAMYDGGLNDAGTHPVTRLTH
jgi:HK97 family phage major capsid protein